MFKDLVRAKAVEMGARVAAAGGDAALALAEAVRAAGFDEGEQISVDEECAHDC